MNANWILRYLGFKSFYGYYRFEFECLLLGLFTWISKSFINHGYLRAKLQGLLLSYGFCKWLIRFFFLHLLLYFSLENIRWIAREKNKRIQLLIRYTATIPTCCYLPQVLKEADWTEVNLKVAPSWVSIYFRY